LVHCIDKTFVEKKKLPMQETPIKKQTSKATIGCLITFGVILVAIIIGFISFFKLGKI